MTAAMKPLSRSKWLKERAHRLGGTDVAAIAGFNPYKSALDVFNEKLGLVPPVEETPIMEAGRLLEPILFRMYAARTGRKVRRTPVLYDPEYPFLIGTPDRAFDDPKSGISGLVEGKTHGARTFATVQNEGVFPGHIVQVQWYLGLARKEWGSFAVLCRETWELIVFNFPFDPVLFASLRDLAVRFQREHIGPRIPPPLVSEPQINVTPVGGEAKVIDDAAIVGALAIYREAKNVVEEAESALSMATDALKATLPEKGAFRLPAATIRYTVEAGRKTLERAALIADGIDPTKYERQGAPYEKLTVYLKKERK